MMQKLGLLFIVLSVVFIAGCVGGPFQSLFGQPGEVHEAPPDIINVQNENVVPTPPVLAGDEFTVSFEVNNVDDINSVSNVNVMLYDWGLCNATKLNQSEGGEWLRFAGEGSYKQALNKLGPGQTKPLTMTLAAPTREQLANLPGRCPVKYKVTYDFTASSSTSAEVISATRLRELQSAGQSPTFTPTTDIGRGPIKIYMAPISALPARSGSTLYVSIQVQNKGTGTYLNIPKGELSLKAPDTWKLTDACGGEFANDTGPSNGYQIYTNSQLRGIDLVGTEKQTFEIRCGFEMPTVPETKDYFLFANLPYSYDLIREIGVDIKPG